MSTRTAYVLLEDGTRYDGIACGADGHAVGEIVFTTGMSGYQESMSDPSFAGQLIAFTYPHIGNYGVSAQAMESERAWARAAIMREACDREDSPGAEGGWLQWLTDCGIPAISGVDTRALVIHIRDRGAMRGGVFSASMPESQARELIESEPPMAGRDLAGQVTPSAVSHHGETNGGPHIAVLDTGIKASMVRELVERGARVTLHPCTSSPTELLAEDPDAVFLTNGPGDPAALDYIVADRAQGRRAQAGVGHLPRPSAAVPRRGPADVQAALRSPRREPSGQGPADGAHRDHLPESRFRGARAGWSTHHRRARGRCAGTPTSARRNCRT